MKKEAADNYDRYAHLMSLYSVMLSYAMLYKEQFVNLVFS